MALHRSSQSWSAHMLAAADDFYASSVIPTVLGNITPHSTGMPALTPVEKHDKKIWEVQQQFYEYSISDESPFTYVKNHRFVRSNYDQLSIVAKRKINKGETINGLVGATYRIEKQYIYEGINDYSLIYSDRVKSDMLFLGPAAFCNHACVPNATLKCINKKLTGVVALKTINPAEEISIFYSKNYFENNNEQCICVTCFEIRQRNTTYTSGSQFTHATPESEIDCTFFGNVVNYSSPESGEEDMSDQKLINSASEEVVIGHTTPVMQPEESHAKNVSDQKLINSTSDEVIGQTASVMSSARAAIDVSDQQHNINSASEEIVIGHTTPVMQPEESHAKNVSDQKLINSTSDEVIGQIMPFFLSRLVVVVVVLWDKV
ncbi:hypothetical protein AGLY_014184 [Aphis glycines]|uniref:SET domain-containing protein n=1 Tax=Aphis glycines TaxID=307491 RepID=A0A6G0T4D0_APHGL|nr:hypothetical protein AGLY_014184 [Aphis glycines]